MEVVFAFYVTYKDNYLFLIFILECFFFNVVLLSVIVSVETSPFASAARSDCVRRPIGLRSGSDRTAYGCR